MRGLNLKKICIPALNFKFLLPLQSIQSGWFPLREDV